MNQETDGERLYCTVQELTVYWWIQEMHTLKNSKSLYNELSE